MADRVLRTDFKRIGRSGPTTDGRVIDPAWIDQMATSYDPQLFTALIWPEHQRFANYGKVESLRATDNSEGGRDLWAVLSPNSFYIGSNQFGQKLFTSMEITFDFRKSGKAYLTGLGATDDPASAGTSEVRFSKLTELAGLQFSGYVEAEEKTFEDRTPESLFEQFKAFFMKSSEDDPMDKQTKDDVAVLKQEFAAIKDMLSTLAKTDDDDKTHPDGDDKSEIGKLKKEFAAIKDTLEKLGKTDATQDDKTSGQQDDPFDTFANKLLAALETKFGKQADKSGDDKSELQAMKADLEKFSKKLDDALKEQPGTNGGEHFGNQIKAEDYL